MADHNAPNAGREEVRDCYGWHGRMKDRGLMLPDIGVPMAEPPRCAEPRRDEETLLRRTRVRSGGGYRGPHIDHLSDGRDRIDYALVPIPIRHRRDAAGLARVSVG